MDVEIHDNLNIEYLFKKYCFCPWYNL